MSAYDPITKTSASSSQVSVTEIMAFTGCAFGTDAGVVENLFGHSAFQ